MQHVENDLDPSCKFGLLTTCEVKMVGYWPSSFFVCLWALTLSWSINTPKKKRTRTISSHLGRTSLVNKGFIIMAFGEILFVGRGR